MGNAEANTCCWIYNNPEYLGWVQSQLCCTLHLRGKIGCGKSVLTKELLKSVQRETSILSPQGEKTSVLFYFCSRVNRPAESASLLLEALIYQYLSKLPWLFPRILQQTDILENNPLSGKSVTWSVVSLWKILVTLLEGSSHASVVFFIDALDECDPSSTEAFLVQFKDYHSKGGTPGKSVKFFISSRNSHHIVRGLYYTAHTFRISITASMVSPEY